MLKEQKRHLILHERDGDDDDNDNVTGGVKVRHGIRDYTDVDM
jgi:hypothetical protein